MGRTKFCCGPNAQSIAPANPFGLQVLATRQGGYVYVDVVKDGQTIGTHDVNIANGRAELESGGDARNDGDGRFPCLSVWLATPPRSATTGWCLCSPPMSSDRDIAGCAGVQARRRGAHWLPRHQQPR